MADVTVRFVQSAAELELALDIAGSVFTPAIAHHDRRFERVAGAWPADRELMYVAEHAGAIVGAALGIRGSLDGVLLAMLAVLPVTVAVLVDSWSRRSKKLPAVSGSPRSLSERSRSPGTSIESSGTPDHHG